MSDWRYVRGVHENDGGTSGGAYLNFDLAWPSTSIPSNFFPSDVALYGKFYARNACLFVTGHVPVQASP